MIRKRIFALVLIFAMLLSLPVPAEASAWTESRVRDMVNAYRTYGESGWDQVEDALDALTLVDPEQGELWRNIMDSWRITNSMEPDEDVLPDGLPEDDSLAIAVMGFGLNANGTMKQELRSRLEVALRSARKYPQAYIVCTGGGTAANSGNTEAGVMAQWLRNQGISDERIITETRAYSTTENAIYTCRKLTRDYPQVRSIAVVTSEYHLYHSVFVFQTMALWSAAQDGTEPLQVVGAACCPIYSSRYNSVAYQAESLRIITGISFGSSGNTTAVWEGAPEAPAEIPAAEPEAPAEPQAQPTQIAPLWEAEREEAPVAESIWE